MEIDSRGILPLRTDVLDINVGNILRGGIYLEIFLDKFLGQIFNALAGAIITLLWTMLRAKKRENDALKEGVQALLRDRIIQAYNHYSDKGWIPIYAMESIEACYKSYEELGENGVIDNLMSQLRELPNHSTEV